MSPIAKASDFRSPTSSERPLQSSVVSPRSSSDRLQELSTLNSSPRRSNAKEGQSSTSLHVSLLTGGADKPYALGFAAALTSEGLLVDFIGSHELSVPELLSNRRVNFLNLRGDQAPSVPLLKKAMRVLTYYVRLVVYAASARPRIFHILWNNKFELFDRTLLMFYYRLLGKRIVLTAHNVNIRKRDGRDSLLNRLSLKVQYQLSDHIFVHTNKMKRELLTDFRVCSDKVSVIPFGINNTVRNSSMSRRDAKRELLIGDSDKALLFFGNIAPYKGLEYLVSALIEALNNDPNYRLLIVGNPKGPRSYWDNIEKAIRLSNIEDRIVKKIEYVPDDTTELYFKAADVLVLPYTNVFQSGVLFLAYSFGLPVIATDVGSLPEEVVQGETGLVCRSKDVSDLALKIEQYFKSDLYLDLENRRSKIKQYANEKYSWSKVAAITTAVYSDLLQSEH